MLQSLTLINMDFDVAVIVSRIGLADVRAFGISWKDCEDFLSRLGYRVSIKVTEKQAMA